MENKFRIQNSEGERDARRERGPHGFVQD